MTSKEIKDVLERVLNWPKERQQDIARVVRLIEEQDKSPLRLTPEQAAEVRRRLREKNPKNIPAEKVFARLLKR